MLASTNPIKQELIMDHDIRGLEKRIKGLVAAIDELAGDDRWNVLLRIIYEKGWTTPAEYKLVNGLVINMTEQVKILGKLQDTLVDGSKAVLEKRIVKK
jgi:hypothetical protein